MCYKRIGALSLAGFFFGAHYASYIGNNVNLKKFSHEAQEQMDKDIVAAFESKYVERSLNASGYGNNALNVGAHTENTKPTYRKPY